jgi:(1->4)-alpha-D-glucan 1-alpha-D-glucosylmutase
MRRVARLAVSNSLAMVTLKLTCPGIPDIYQGSEGWNFSMVDPDNRRPVDYVRQARQLEVVRQQQINPGEAFVRKCVEECDDTVKLLVTHALLQFRRSCEALFRDGDYLAIAAAGALRDCACIYQRQTGGDFCIVVVGRFPSLTAGGWEDTHFSLPGESNGPLRDVLTGREYSGGTLKLKSVLDLLPVAVLVPATLRANVEAADNAIRH